MKNKKLDRRELLRIFGQGGSAIFMSQMLPFSPKLIGDSVNRDKFILYIHCGSWDGWTSGITLASDVGVYPKSVFQNGVVRGSVNPNVNVHYKTGNLVFNNYNKFLAPIANHMCFTVGNPRNLDHETGNWYQATGGIQTSPNCSWVTGVAQALSANSSVIVNAAQFSAKRTAATKDVAVANAAKRDAFVTAMSDTSNIPKGVYVDRFWELMTQLNKNAAATSADVAAVSADIDAYTKNLIRGVPEIAAGATITTDVTSSISLAAVQAVIDADVTNNNDGAAVKAAIDTQLLEKLQLAAMLAKSKLAKGMAIDLLDQDIHDATIDNKSSSVLTARSGSQLWAQIRVFWDWVKTNGLEDDIMVIVSHEFTRSPYNPSTSTGETVMFNGVSTPVSGPGTDHHLLMGMVFINGKVPSAGRVGGIGDGYVAFGSSGFTGVPNSSLPSYTSTQLVGSMLMRCFDDIFVNDRVVKNFWTDFVPIDLVIA